MGFWSFCQQKRKIVPQSPDSFNLGCLGKNDGYIINPLLTSGKAPLHKRWLFDVLGNQIHEMTQQESVLRWVICNRLICSRVELSKSGTYIQPEQHGELIAHLWKGVCHRHLSRSLTVSLLWLPHPTLGFKGIPPDPFNFLIIFSIWWCWGSNSASWAC